MMSRTFFSAAALIGLAVSQTTAANNPAASQPRSSPVTSAEPADAPRAPIAGDTALIPAGTRVRVRLAQTLSTRRTRPGSVFTATLDAPVVVGDRVVVPRGTPFQGVVVASKRSGRLRGRAFLEVRLRSFRMGGVRYRIVTAADTRVSRSHKRRNLILMGGGTATGAGIGALAGGGTGALIGAGVGAAAGTTTALITGRKNVTLPVETRLVFALETGVRVRRG